MDIIFIGSNDSINQGTRNDISFDPVSKDIKLVGGSTYVKQKIVKALLTSLNSDPNFPTYGTQLNDQIFKSISDPNTQQQIMDTIVAALNYTEAQETSTDASEHILSIDNIELVAKPEQQGVYVRVDITLRTGQSVTLAVGS